MKTTYREQGKGILYERDSTMHGGGWYSYERNINPGDMRVINGIISKAWMVTNMGFFKKPRIHWISVNPEALKKVDINDKPEKGI